MAGLFKPETSAQVRYGRFADGYIHIVLQAPRHTEKSGCIPHIHLSIFGNVLKYRPVNEE